MNWRVAKSLLRLRDQVNEMAPQRNRGADGTIGDAAHASRKSDHNPWIILQNIGVVSGMDITNDPDNDCDAAAIVQALVNSRDYRIKYIIWNKQIISSLVEPWKWRRYEGSNPHTRHFHLSVKSDQAVFDAIDFWKVQ